MKNTYAPLATLFLLGVTHVSPAAAQESPAKASEPTVPASEPTPPAETTAPGEPAAEPAPSESAAPPETEKPKGPRVLLVTAHEPPADTQAPAEVAPPDPNTQPFTHHQLGWALAVGLQVNWVSSGGLDPFAANDALVSPLVRLGYYPWSSGRLSLGFAADWSSAGAGSSARDSTTDLRVHRLGLGLEARYHLHHRFTLYGRISPGATASRAGLLDESGTSYAAESWLFRVDGTLGATARLAGSSDGAQRGVRLLAYLEGGFDWTQSQTLSLEAQGTDPPRAEPIALGSLDLSSPHLGGGLLVTY